MSNYVNYHKHSHYSNIITPDSAVTPLDYMNRALELGQTVLSSVEHGSVGRYMEYYDLAKQNGLKYLFGLESYIVKDRLLEIEGKKDATNAHIVLLAKNENGRKNINRIISQANIDGFYYKPRIDLGLLFSLPKDDVWVTTACLGGVWKLDQTNETIAEMYSYFGKNFFLEVQTHHVKEQAILNRRIINISNQCDIPIIAGMDSHYIYPNQAKDRDDFLLSRGVKYEDEANWFMDYPSYDEAYQRFVKQGSLSANQIKEALDNTLIFEQVEDYDSPIFNMDIKLPTLYPDKTQQEKNDIFKDLVMSKWQEEKVNIPEDKLPLYEQEIAKEIDTVIATHMADYFLLDYEIVKLGVEKGGHITLSSRGSSSSYYLSKLLGFTTVDRISSEVKLFPERFITKERILEAGTLPDIDLNLGNPEVFYQAQKEILGENNSFPMLAYGTAKPKAAWKIYSRAIGLDFPTANAVSADIDKYEMALKHAETEDDRQDIDVMEYINPKYVDMYNESLKYQGIVNDAKVAPCGYLIYNGDIPSEIGLIKLKDNLCTVMDGAWAEKYNFLKNDLLKVSVVELIYRVYEKIGIEPHTLQEIITLSEGDNKVWDVYKNSWTMGINQLEQTSTKGRVAKYAPKNISELSAFVAAIRPGFKSFYKKFEQREPFSFGVDSLDKIIQTPKFPFSYMLYQENAMSVLQYAGVPTSETYEVVKNIAKKRAEKVYKYKEIFIEGMTERLVTDENIKKARAEEIAHETWQVIEDSSQYSFNACLSGDTILRGVGKLKDGHEPTIEQMFLIKNSPLYAVATGHTYTRAKYRTKGYGCALSMNEHCETEENQIINIAYAGCKQTYRVKTESGAGVVCTANHKLPSGMGVKMLSQLAVGDYVYVSEHDGYRVDFERIISITPENKTDVYDVSMETPYHTVVTNTGLVVSNSHSYSVAGDSLYGAYLKSHYPLEFYGVLLNLCEEDSDKERLVAVKDEARRAYKINFPPYRFGQDNRAIVTNTEKWEITSSLQSIKGFGKKVGEDMYILAQTHFDNFVDLMLYAEDNNMLYSYFEKLIQIQYFDMFGGNLKLHEFYKEFTSGKNRYLRTHTDKTKEKRKEALREYWNTLENANYSLVTQIAIELEVLGAIQMQYDVPKEYLYVISVDTQYAPRIETYCLATGRVNSLKIRKKVYENNIFYGGDIIKLDLTTRSNGTMLYFTKEPRRKFENGTFIDSEDEFDWWTSKYDIVDLNKFSELMSKTLDKVS